MAKRHSAQRSANIRRWTYLLLASFNSECVIFSYSFVCCISNVEQHHAQRMRLVLCNSRTTCQQTGSPSLSFTICLAMKTKVLCAYVCAWQSKAMSVFFLRFRLTVMVWALLNLKCDTQITYMLSMSLVSISLVIFHKLKAI